MIHDTRACLKNHFRKLQAPLCGIFYPHSVAVARYAALIRIKSPTNWDSQLAKSLFQTRSRRLHLYKKAAVPGFFFPAQPPFYFNSFYTGITATKQYITIK